MYDILSDIHGRGTALVKMIDKLGYHFDTKKSKMYHPKNRRLISLGDLLDRGHDHETVFFLLKPAHQAGDIDILMGNHEFNAICLATKGPDGQWIRPESKRNQSETFFAEYPFGSPKHLELVEWFKTFPLFLEKDGVCFIHALWNDADIENVRKYLDENNCLTHEGLMAYASHEQPFRRSLDNILKSPYVKLPEHAPYEDQHGKKWDEARFLPWANADDPLHEQIDIRGMRYEGEDLEEIQRRYSALAAKFNRPAAGVTFVGHYSLPQGPIIQNGYVCLDTGTGVNAYRLPDDEDLKLHVPRHELVIASG